MAGKIGGLGRGLEALFAENAVDGMRSRQEILQVMTNYPRREI